MQKLKTLKKSLKFIVTLVIPIIALGFSVYAIYIDNSHYKQSIKLESQQYQELTIPHTQHQEIMDMLARLDMRIEKSQKSIQEWAKIVEPSTDFQNNLSDAQEMSDDAEEAWLNKDYEKANDLINKAFETLYTIPTPPILHYTTTGLSDYIDELGTFKVTAIAFSNDEHVKITIGKGTTGKTLNGTPLTYLIIKEIDILLLSPDSYSILYPVYDIEPNGANFDSPITITFDYDKKILPEGVNEGDLVVGYYDRDNGKWLLIEQTTSDTTKHTISIEVNHFTAFALLYPQEIAMQAWWLLVVIIVSLVVVTLVVSMLMISRRRK